MQYLAAGPCTDVAEAGRCLATSSADLMSEDRWRAVGQASAAMGVRSTLTFPVLHGDVVSGTVNLYGRADDTFHGKHQALAEVFRAWAPGAVTNADLSFSTRRLAERAPRQLRDDAVVDTATGILSAMHGLTIAEARDRIEESAARAGLSVASMAQTIIALRNP